MTAARGVRHYLTPSKAADFNPRDEVRRDSSNARQESELARQRAQALDLVRLPASPLPAMRWIAHVLSNAGRKGGLAC